MRSQFGSHKKLASKISISISLIESWGGQCKKIHTLKKTKTSFISIIVLEIFLLIYMHFQNNICQTVYVRFIIF